MTEPTIIMNKSEGYGYKYSNLADLARAGVKIPQMRTKCTDCGEFVEYLDDKGEWQQGARVVLFESKGMNAAQAYGAALTYARRYTVQMSEKVACDDDDAVEKAKPTAQNPRQSGAKPAGNIDFKATDEAIANAKTLTELKQIYEAIPEKVQKYFIKACSKRKEELKGAEA